MLNDIMHALLSFAPAQALAQLQMPQQPPDPRAQLLAQLNDVIAPSHVSWWPPAPGWWLLFTILLLGTAALIRFVLKYWQKRRYRRQAIRELQKLKSQAQHTATSHVNQSILELLKRCAFSAYPDSQSQIASLYGRQWLEWLQASCPKSLELDGALQNIDEIYYGAKSESEAKQLQNALLTLAEVWIKNHYNKPPNLSSTSAVVTAQSEGARC